jgi:hypothetical protein
MSYMDIENLYKAREILSFKECFAMEKIHGSSAHISWKEGNINFFSGGEKHEKFITIFDKEKLNTRYAEIAPNKEPITIYGEVYGGKCQGMSKTYVPDMMFVAFEVRINNSWLSVPAAEGVARSFGLDFVHYRTIPTTLEAIDAERDLPSAQSVKVGIIEERKREGVVLRPPFEVLLNNGKRVIAKHKREDFQETKTARPLDKNKLMVLTVAEDIATEWVTEMRLSHVLDLFPDAGIEKTGEIIKAMIDDVVKESTGEILDSPEARKAISRKTAIMFKNRLKSTLSILKENE